MGNDPVIQPLPRRGRGRPVSELKKVPMTITLPEATFRKLENYARSKGLYKGQVLRDLIEDRLQAAE